PRSTRTPREATTPVRRVEHWRQIPSRVQCQRTIVAAGRVTSRAPLVSVVCLLCILITGRAAEGAIDDYVGKSIASVHLVIEGRETSDPALVRVVETQPGQTLTIGA